MPESSRAPHADVMLVDDQTFKDLEIFEAATNGGRSLFDLIGQTRTLGGARVLRERMKRPWSSAERIRAVQRSLAWILEHRVAFERLPTDVVVLDVDEYLKSGLPLVISENRLEVFIGALEVRFGDFRPYGRIVRGVVRTSRMLRGLQGVLAPVADAPAPGEVGRILDELRTLVDRPAFAEVEERWDMPAWTVLALDRVFRLREQAALRRMIELVHQLDALVAMADALPDYGLALPEVVDGPLHVVGEGLVNLFVRDPVPAPVRLDQEQRMLFLTGPNMAGKTTYLRSCGVAVYLAHLGMGVPARRLRFAPGDCLLTSLSTTDSVRDGISFFRAEALRIKSIAEAVTSGRRVVALMDEPFKGTNVKDALDASWAVLDEFAHSTDSLFLVSSHLIELGPDVQATGRADCRRFEAAETEQGLTFDYVLREGISSQRLGMKVLEQEGIFRLFRRRPSPRWSDPVDAALRGEA